MSEFKNWCIVELLGHKRLAGMVTEEEIFGTKLGRVDIPTEDGFVTQYFGGGSVYAITPCTEERARQYLGLTTPKPVALLEAKPPADESPFTAEEEAEIDEQLREYQADTEALEAFEDYDQEPLPF